MKKISIMGSGAWASGLATVLSKNNHKVLLWGIEKQEVDDINNGVNTKHFGPLKFNNPKNVSATLDLGEALKDFDYLILAVPSSAIVEVLQKVKKVINDKKINIINVAKGFDSRTNSFFSEVLKNEFGNNIKNYCSLIGPSFATEVFENRLSMVNIVGPNARFLKEVSTVFNNDKFRTVINNHEQGCELFATFKNVLAIGIGMIEYMMPYRNTQAALLSIGVKEIDSVYKLKYPKGASNLGFELAAIGDIFLTCSSKKSRNFSFGYEVAKNGLENTLMKNKSTIEGYHNAKILDGILKDNPQLEAPFLRSIIDVLYYKKEPKNLLDFINSY